MKISYRSILYGLVLLLSNRLQAESPNLHRVIFTDSKNGIALATSANEALVLRTRDGGEEWQVTYRTSKFLRVLHMAGSSHGWIGGNEGFLLETKDGGEHWNPVATGIGQNINDVRYEDPMLYIAADRGVLLRSQNPGQEWSSQLLGSGTGFGSDLVSLTKFGVRLFLLARKQLFFSDDNGTTWRSSPEYRWDTLLDVVFFDDNQ